MAHILPETLPQLMPPEVHRTFRALKALPDSYYIWHHLAPWQPDAPDFLLISRDYRPLLIKVSSASASQAVPAAQMLLLQDERSPLGETETRILQNFVECLKLPPDQPLSSLVLFPNIQHRQVIRSRPPQSGNDCEPKWAGKELLQQEGINWEDFLPDKPMDPLYLEKVRQAFSPEAVIPAEMTVRPPADRRIEAGLTDYLLDYNQEAAVKADLDLTSEGQALSDDFRVNIINGVAGSGKTLILLFRLKLLYQLYPNKRFLVLTHNKPLIRDLQSRFYRLEGKLPDNIEWRTFNSWCYHHWPEEPAWIQPLSVNQRERIIHMVWCKQFGEPGQGNTTISPRMLTSEFDWIKDQLPMTRDDYLKADRRGRGFRLTAEQREQIYQALETYQKILQDRNALDWGDIAQRLWQFEQEGRITLPTYDVLLIDEAQFFAPLWIAILQKLLKPPNAHLFIVADPTQGFLGRGASWKSLGIQARGRSQQLRRSYRTTREILEFASLFYRLRLSEENEEDILTPDLLKMPNGVLPEMIHLTSSQDEISRVANEVEAFVRKGYPRKHLLILHANGQGVQALKEAINRRLGRDAAIDPKDTYPGDYIRVTTLNAGAGLESPIVFLVGLRELFEEEQSLRLSDDEREALIRDNTRRIYMAATRAGQRLVFTYVGPLPEILQNLLQNKGFQPAG
ncbi:MAG: UvrD-helicase domain-containing protein [Chloroflexi bacterium]|nr:UvrD-helicase domain-containing protein [Chloroflexota bacterium]